jgi:trans-2,3-dihydro-3-hydroxyanthranilate isomerase
MPVVRYVICDVFTDRPFSGNQLAVFTDARALDAATMQALAREMNFSESTFVLPATEGGHARIRIFTPLHEIPFAGHPTLGTAIVLGLSTGLESIRLETGAGIVPVRFEREGGGVSFGWMTQPLPKLTPFEQVPALLRALGVSASGLPVDGYDNGLRHVYVELPSREAVAALRPDMAALAALPADWGFYVFAGGGPSWKSRMFAPGHGVPEDPATGSAAGPLAVHLAHHGRIPWGQEIIIEQGAELGRPSRLHARAIGTAETLTAVEVGGAAVVMGRGEFNVRGAARGEAPFAG